MMDYEKIVKSYIGHLSGRDADSIDLDQPLDSYIPRSHQQAFVVLMELVPDRTTRRDLDIEKWLVHEPMARGQDLAHYVGYLAGDTRYPRPKPGK